MTDATHILLVDDEARIRSVLSRYLTREGFQVSQAENGTGLRQMLATGSIDLILLDLMLPGEDGLTLARHIRQTSDIPVIMLTGKSDLIDRVVGLETGADDYIAKPFELREVLARIRSVLRRARVHPPPAPSAEAASGPAREILTFEGWRLDLPKRELRRPNGEVVALTAGDFNLLQAFVQHPSRVLSRDQLADLVKGRDWAGFDQAVVTQVARLRRKLQCDTGTPPLIKTVRGGGYVFAATVKPA